MSTDPSIRPFVFRDPHECFVPSDVAGALGLPSHIRQVSLTVFSVSARTAWAHLRALGLVHQKSHRLVEAHDVYSQALANLTHIVTEGTVFMYLCKGGRIPVVEIMPPSTGSNERIVTFVGFLRPKLWVTEESSRLREYVWEPPDGVTDAMLKAACAELSDHEPPTLNDIRRALRAALDIRRTEFGTD